MKNLEEGYHIVTADTMPGLERVLKDTRPDLVITDTDIDKKPELADILRLVKEKNPLVKVIVTAEEKIAPDAIYPDVSAIIEKPFYCQELIRLLKEGDILPVSRKSIRYNL